MRDILSSDNGFIQKNYQEDNLRNEKFTNPGKKQDNFVEKMKLTPELKNVLEIAALRENSAAKKENSKFANLKYYDFEFKLDGEAFKGNINIGITDKGKYLYEINNVKKPAV